MAAPLAPRPSRRPGAPRPGGRLHFGFDLDRPDHLDLPHGEAGRVGWPGGQALWWRLPDGGILLAGPVARGGRRVTTYPGGTPQLHIELYGPRAAPPGEAERRGPLPPELRTDWAVVEPLATWLLTTAPASTPATTPASTAATTPASTAATTPASTASTATAFVAVAVAVAVAAVAVARKR